MNRFETKNVIPFEDKCYFDRAYIFCKIIKPSSYKEKRYIEKHKNACYKSKKEYEHYKEYCYHYNKKCSDLDFFNLLYVFINLGTGKKDYLYLCDNNSLNRYIKNKYKDKTVFRSFKKISDSYKYDTVIIKDTLVFRFFRFNPSFYKEGEKQGYYEIFRLCFNKTESWGENREELYNFDLRYMVENNLMYKFNKFSAFDINKISADIFKVYPFLENQTGYSWNNTNFVKFNEFCYLLNSLYKTEKVFKYVPQYIVSDLSKKYVLTPSELKEFEYRKKSCYSKLCCKLIKKDEFLCFHIFSDNLEIERVYVNENNIFKFGYNFFLKKWVSTKRENMECIHVENSLFFYGKGLKRNNSWQDFGILKRYSLFLNNCIFPLKNLFLQRDILFLEQAVKMGFNDFFRECSYNRFLLYHVMESFDKNFSKYDIKSFKKKSLSEILKIPSSQLKNLNKNLCFENIRLIHKRYNNKFFIENFSDVSIRTKIVQLNIEDNKIKKIVKLFKNNNKDYKKFLLSLIDKGYAETAINHYIDYLKFRPKANLFGEHNYPEILKPSEIGFMHDKAYRDYMYQKAKTEKKKKNSLEDRFFKVVNSEEYLNFLDYDDDNFCIIGAKTSIDLIEEGRALSHCVGGYRDRMSRGKSFIYFLRRKECENVPYYTLEVKENYDKKDKKKYILSQCYGKHDTIKKDSFTRKYILNWCKKKKIKQNCMI